MTNAERQKKYRERMAQKRPKPKIIYRHAADRRSRPQRWRGAIQELRELLDEYQNWLDNLPEMAQGTMLEEKLRAVTSLDTNWMYEWEEVDLPIGFGRD